MDIRAATVPGYAGSPKGGSGVGAANTLQTICLLSALLLTTLPPRPLLAMNQGVLLLLPDSSETVGWHAPDSARVFVGNNLFLLIDGGAPVYLEYGFGQVVAQRYVNEKNERVSLEIYEMIDAGAAYGMFCRQGLRI